MQRLICLILLFVVLVACDALPGAPANTASDTGEVALVGVQNRSAEDVARAFLDAWSNRNLDAMYDLISPQSREIYPFERFSDRYNVLHDVTNFQGVRYTFQDMRPQGNSTAITYDLTIDSPVFGDMPDNGRIMRLVNTERGWQVAWTPMDIINNLTSDISFRLDSVSPERANIYDRNGSPLVQENGSITALYLNERDMADRDACFELLARLTPPDVAYYVRLFTNYNADTIVHVAEIDQRVFSENRAEFDAACGTANTSGKVRQYNGRAYYGHGLAAHITGYAGRVPADRLEYWQNRGYGSGDIVGLSGIEFQYQDELAGIPARTLRMIEPGGTVIRQLGGTTAEDPTPIMLTIDRDLQFMLSQAIADAYSYAGINWATVASGAGAVVMDIDTGEILALSSYPTYDPNIFNPDSSYEDTVGIINAISGDRRSPLSNKAVQETYTPGSVYKLFTAAAVLDNNIFTEDTFDCQLIWRGPNYGDTVAFRQDWRVVDEMPAAGVITAQQAIAASCNPFFWEMGGRMFQQNPNIQSDYAALFGFGSRTGMGDIGIEATGSVARPGNPTAAINNAIGQGNIQTSALQMVTAVAAIANDGKLYEPQIVRQIGGMDGTSIVETVEPNLVRNLSAELGADVLETIREGMCLVPVDQDYGTAIYVFDENMSYSHCGKTGTAQAGTVESGIAPHAWYVAFAPAENPEIAITVVVPNSLEGSQVSAPITRRFLDQYFDAPVAPFPEWWEEPYVPIQPPVGVVAAS